MMEPGLLCGTGADDNFYLPDNLIRSGNQSAVASIPAKSKPGNRRLSLCDLYGGGVLCHTDPHPGK